MIKEFKFLLILFVLIDHNQVFGEGMLIDDMRNIEGEPQGEYCENDTTKWCLITDRVMGGVSEGDLCCRVSVYRMYHYFSNTDCDRLPDVFNAYP